MSMAFSRNFTPISLSYSINGVALTSVDNTVIYGSFFKFYIDITRKTFKNLDFIKQVSDEFHVVILLQMHVKFKTFF